MRFLHLHATCAWPKYISCTTLPCRAHFNIQSYERGFTKNHIIACLPEFSLTHSRRPTCILSPLVLSPHSRPVPHPAYLYNINPRCPNLCPPTFPSSLGPTCVSCLLRSALAAISALTASSLPIFAAMIRAVVPFYTCTMMKEKFVRHVDDIHKWLPRLLLTNNCRQQIFLSHPFPRPQKSKNTIFTNPKLLTFAPLSANALTTWPDPARPASIMAVFWNYSVEEERLQQRERKGEES